MIPRYGTSTHEPRRMPLRFPASHPLVRRSRQEVVVPLLGVNGTAIVAISTPLGEDNWYTGLIQKKTEDGERLFNVVQYSLVCDECRKKDLATECQHKIELLPPWKSESRQRLVKFLLSDSSDLYLTEAMGEISSSKSRCFQEELVDAWILRPLRAPSAVGSAATVYVAVDPTSGIRSELAVVSMYFDTSRRLVVSLRAAEAGALCAQDARERGVGLGLKQPEDALDDKAVARAHPAVAQEQEQALARRGRHGAGVHARERPVRRAGRLPHLGHKVGVCALDARVVRLAQRAHARQHVLTHFGK